MTAHAYDEYFADPFVLALPDGGYAAYGGAGAPTAGGPVFESLASSDLRGWEPRGRVLEPLAPEAGDEYWAPEVAVVDGRYRMYYSVGHGSSGHRLRVASADDAFGPFRDEGVDLAAGELFAIDPHPFTDVDGTRYLFFAHDVLDAERPGTHLAVARFTSPTSVELPATPVLAPYADWQIYEHDRPLYGRRFEWHTLEGPSVVRRHDRYWMTFSGGAWTGEGYAVTWAVADHPLGPWTPAPEGAKLLQTRDDLIGPGHNSLTVAPDGRDVIAFHSWDEARERRRMHLRYLDFTPEGPRLGEPIGAAPQL